MIEIRYLRAESGANKFGTCNCCGKSSGEDPLMISVKFSYYGHGTLICLCDDCKKKLMEVLPSDNNSEIPNSSDTISRAKAIEALWEKRQALNDYMEILLQDGKMSSRYLTKIERNRIEEDINIIEELPPAQPAPSQVAADIARIVENGKDMRVIEAAQPTPDQNGDLWITVPDIDKVTCIYVQESKSKFCRIFYEER